MERKITLKRGLLAVLACAALGGALASPTTAQADGNQGKGKKVPIIIGTPIVSPDPDPTPPPKKK